MRKGFVRPLRLSEHLSGTSPERSRAIGIWFEKLVRLDAMISREAILKVLVDCAAVGALDSKRDRFTAQQ